MLAENGYDGRAIANIILDACEKSNRRVTNLALQKIVFFCHAWSLLHFRRPLVKHEFEAWKHGPVLPYLYREFKEFDGSQITRRALSLDPVTGKKVVASCELEPPLEQFLIDVTDFYSRLTAGQLVELSHVTNGPWDLVWNHGGQTNPGMKIKDEQIFIFYSQAARHFETQ